MKLCKKQQSVQEGGRLGQNKHRTLTQDMAVHVPAAYFKFSVSTQ